MKGLIIITFISLLNLIFGKDPATNVLVIESAACGNCKYFNYRDLSYILKKQNYQDVVNIKLLPTAHLMEQMANGTYIYTHRFGEDFLRGAFAQICANNLYSNAIALKWGSSSAYSRKSLNDTIKDVFTEDAGSNMLSCVFGKQGHQFARLAWLEYKKNALGGMLPIVIVNGKRESYTWDKNGFFLDSICRNRADKVQLEACTGIKRTELDSLFEQSYDNFNSGDAIEEEIKEVKSEAFDYQKFWATPDDDEETPLVGFEGLHASKDVAKKMHLKFFDSDDE